jgi:hypothetical protein
MRQRGGERSAPVPAPAAAAAAAEEGDAEAQKRAADETSLRGDYQLTRVVFLRFLGGVYLVAFLGAAYQLRALVGERGLLPADVFLQRVAEHLGGACDSIRGCANLYVQMPTLFWLDSSDEALAALSYTGVLLALLAVQGAALNAVLFAALWVLYQSLPPVGQVFYGFGWEAQLLETGFLAIFLAPLRGSARTLPARSPPSRLFVALLLWLEFRIMLGAGLIKLRSGDPCWRDLTCLHHHYETQPIPNPLSYYLHAMPGWFHSLGVLVNHVVELAVPWLLLLPWRGGRMAAGSALIAFQLVLITSGNLSFLNWLTIAPCIACFDSEALAPLFPAENVRRLRRQRGLADHAPKDARNAAESAACRFFSRVRGAVNVSVAALLLYLSKGPVLNLLSHRQVMNRSFDAFRLVNTYGAFGTVGKERYEVVLEGSPDAQGSEWREYEFVCKPGRVDRMPCVRAPYQLRLDWQMWFAAMQSYQQNPWLLRLVELLLRNDPLALSLLDAEANPFPNAPPRLVRARLFRYGFTNASSPTQATDWYWRHPVAEYLPPVSLEAFQDAAGGARRKRKKTQH